MTRSYLGQSDFDHRAPQRAAVLLVNLGTPDAPEPAALRRYLAEFLADPRVIEAPRWLWLPLLHGIILPFRAGRSARTYREVWTAQGSPLRVHSEALAAALQDRLRSAGSPLEVRLAMRYGTPSIPSVLRELQREGLRRLLLLPLYPQFSATTTASVFDAVSAELARWRWPPELRTIAEYHGEPAWIGAVADSIRAHWQQHGRGDRLLFSFHGIPERYFRAGDPYFCQCQASARAIAAHLGLAASQWQVAFQSQVGRERWLQPYTEDVVRRAPREGVARLDVVCPGFAVDCLETLEEIELRNAAAFVAAGGESLRYVPALNSDAGHVAALEALLQRHVAGWPEADPAFRAAAEAESRAARREAFGGG